MQDEIWIMCFFWEFPEIFKLINCTCNSCFEGNFAQDSRFANFIEFLVVNTYYDKLRFRYFDKIFN